MAPEEVDAFVVTQRSSTTATVGASGAMALVAMWFGWHEARVRTETGAEAHEVVDWSATHG